MTVTDVRRRLVRIGSAARSGDFEAAHEEEKKLFVDVLRAVAAGKAGSNVALAALQSLELQFTRVYS